jgi:hypothetical protein
MSESVGDDEVVLVGEPEGPMLAIGAEDAIEALGQTVGVARGPAITQLLSVLGLGGELAGLIAIRGGRWVQLTEETATKLADHGVFASDKAGVPLGLLRNEDGTIAHVARFSGNMAANPAHVALLFQSMVTQRRLARIERQLTELAEATGTVIDLAQVSEAAELAAGLEIIRRVESRVDDRGVVDERDWASLAALEHSVRRMYQLTTQWLEPLDELLTDEQLPVREQVRLARSQVGTRDLSFWLITHAWSEVALNRWEGLYLLHEAETAPERLAVEAMRIEDDARDRYETVRARHALLAAYVDRTDELTRWQRLGIINRVRLAHLRIQLGNITNAYAEALDETSEEVPEFVPEDASEVGPLIDLDRLREEVGTSVLDGVRAGSELARDTGRRAGGGVRRGLTAGGDRWRQFRGARTTEVDEVDAGTGKGEDGSGEA